MLSMLYSPHSYFLQKKTQTSYQTTPSRVIVLHPTLPVEPALFEMFSLTQYSEPELDPMWVAVWCYVVFGYLLLLSVSSVLQGLYGYEPSDVINVASAS